MQRLLAVSAATLLGAAAPAHAEDFGFKGAQIGSPISLIANNPKYDCKAVLTPTADRICALKKNESETIAGAPVLSVFYFYDQTRLTGIQITLEEKYFRTAVDALTGKYGPPALTRTPLKNLKGIAFENQTYTWRALGQSMVAERYAGRLDRAMLRMAEEGAAQRIRAQREALAREPRKDL